MKSNPLKAVFDADIHQTFSSQEALYPYFPKHVIDRVKKSGLGYPRSPYYSPLSYKRKDASPPSGLPAGSDKDFLKKQLLGDMGIKAGVLNGSGIIACSYIPEIEYPVQLAWAYNEWMINEWLENEKEFYGSLHIALQNPEKTAEMIRKLGTHPKVLQIVIPTMTPLPIGHQAYKPIIEACVDTGLAIAFHIWQPSMMTGHATPLGNPLTYIEWKTLCSFPMISQMVNLIMTGVFVEYPTLKVAFVEGGYSWLVYFKNRMEQLYKSFRMEVPWLKHSPEYYLYKHCRLTTQPLEELEGAHVSEILTNIKLDDLLIYSSDYPHWDTDNPSQIRKYLPGLDMDKILYKNAVEFYGLKM